MAVKGVFASDQNVTASRKGDFASAILYGSPSGSAPLLALTAGMKSSPATDTATHWFDQNFVSGREEIVNNAVTNTSITVTDASAIVPGLVYIVENTGEYLFVNAVSGNTLTVDRGFGGTTVTPIDGTGTPVDIQRISSAHEEGSGIPAAVAHLAQPKWQYQQIFRNSWDVTGTAAAVAYHTGSIVSSNKAEAMNCHAEDQERAFWWGVMAIGSQNGKPFRTMGGIDSNITTNVYAQGANTQAQHINSFLKDIFATSVRGQPNERIAFCGNTVVEVINKLAAINGTTQLKAGETEFGLQIMKWLTPFGNINLMTHPLMNASPLWSKNLYVLHPAVLRTRYLRKTVHEDNAQDSGSDATAGVFTTECSLELRKELVCGKFTGIDTAAADA